MREARNLFREVLRRVTKKQQQRMTSICTRIQIMKGVRISMIGRLFKRTER